MSINRCPNCGGNRNVKVDNRHLKCEYCGTIFEIDNPEPCIDESEQGYSSSTAQASAFDDFQSSQFQTPPLQEVNDKSSGNVYVLGVGIILVVLGLATCISGSLNIGIPGIILGIILGALSQVSNRN